MAADSQIFGCKGQYGLNRSLADWI